MKHWLNLILLLSLTVGACQKHEEKLPELTFRQRELADTLYLQRINVLRPLWDSLCTTHHDSLVQVAVDSLIRVRKAEEARLRARIQQQILNLEASPDLN